MLLVQLCSTGRCMYHVSRPTAQFPLGRRALLAISRLLHREYQGYDCCRYFVLGLFAPGVRR